MPNEISRFALLGGDARHAHAANVFVSNGYGVSCCGLENYTTLDDSVKRVSSIAEAVRSADAVILPLPVSHDGRTIYAPFASRTLYLAEVFLEVRPTQLILGGHVQPKLFAALSDRGLRIYDYYRREDAQILNAIPTAEGALEIAMRETDRTINGSKCLVCGNGRIGKYLAACLRSLGADVTVSARRSEDLALIRLAHHKAIKTDDIGVFAGNFDIVFNTIPALILDQETLARLKASTVIVDLASVPGGVDFEAAESLRIKALQALSLPGKVAPITAGEIVVETILRILNETQKEKDSPLV